MRGPSYPAAPGGLVIEIKPHCLHDQPWILRAYDMAESGASPSSTSTDAGA